MKKEDLDINKFAKSCMENDTGNMARKNHMWFEECVEKAKDTWNFYELYFATKDEDIICSQGYGELLKRLVPLYKGFDRYVNNITSHASEHYFTVSDWGRLKIGVNDTYFYVPNGYGDGTTFIHIFHQNDDAIKWLNAVEHIKSYSSTIEGKFDIINYDMGKDVLATVDGNFNIYYFNRDVVFVEV